MATTTQNYIPAAIEDPDQREAVFDIFRRWGYLQATLDPLGQYLPPEPFPTPVPEGDLAAEARAVYCGSIALEFMHIANNEQRQWLQQQMEQPPSTPDQAHMHLITKPVKPKKTPHNTWVIQSMVFMVERGWCLVLKPDADCESTMCAAIDMNFSSFWIVD